jgi:hypothetical protein
MNVQIRLIHGPMNFKTRVVPAGALLIPDNGQMAAAALLQPDLMIRAALYIMPLSVTGV